MLPMCLKAILLEAKPSPRSIRMLSKVLLYGIDMEQSQYSKTFDSIPEPDIAISMGCDVGCPYIGRAFDDNWGLNDPTGCPDEAFREIISQIEGHIIRLKIRIEGGVYG